MAAGHLVHLPDSVAAVVVAALALPLFVFPLSPSVLAKPSCKNKMIKLQIKLI